MSVEIFSQLRTRTEPGAFYARRGLRKAISNWYQDTDGFPTFYGARIIPFAHQLYAARRVLGDRTQRFLLADEVGLGKTIEAGLILQALWHQSPRARVLVVTPGSMVTQWFRELYLRFGARAFCRLQVNTPEEELDRGLSTGKLIASTAALVRDPALQERIADQEWDVLIVDEAHHLDRSHPMYDVLLGVSRRAGHALVLSATPTRRNLSGFAAVMSLVAPDEYDPRDVSGLQRRIESRETVWNALDGVGRLVKSLEAFTDEVAISDITDVANEFGPTLQADTTIRDWLDRAQSAADVESGLEWLRRAYAYARGQWRLDDRIIRTRRQTLAFLNQEFPTRRLIDRLTYSACAGETQVATLLEQLPTSHSDSERVWTELVHQVAGTTPALLKTVIEQRRDAVEATRGATRAPEPVDAEHLARAWNSEPGPGDEAALRRQIPLVIPPLVGGEDDDLFDEVAWCRQMETAIAAWEQADGAVPKRFQMARDWILEQLEADPERRILVFSQVSTVVGAFVSWMQDACQADETVEGFHHEMETAEQDRAADAFSGTGPARVLVCDELGGEGRNFQQAWAVLHLDIPLSPARVEQRIGRLDRLGRRVDDDVRSAVVLGPIRTESYLFRAHGEILRIYEESIGRVEAIMPEIVVTLKQSLCATDEGYGEALADLGRQVKDCLAEADSAFQTALDTSRAELKRSEELAEVLKRSPSKHRQPMYWLRAVGMRVNEVGGAAWKDDLSSIAHDPEWSNVEQLRGIPRFEATWSRSVALEHEAYQFVALGHQVIDEAVEYLDASALGGVALIERPVNEDVEPGVYFVATFVQELPVYEDLPVGLLARVRGRVGRTVESVYFRAEDSKFVLERNPLVKKWIDAAYEGNPRRYVDARDRNWSEDDPFLKGEGMVEFLARLTNSIAQVKTKTLAEKGAGVADDLEREWQAEFAYFQAMQERADDEVSQVRAEAEILQRRLVIEQVRRLQPVLDSVLLINMVPRR